MARVNALERSPEEKPILLVLTSTFPKSKDDASPRFVLDLASRLTPKFRVMVLAPHGPGLPKRETVDSVEVVRFRYLPERMETLAYSGGIPDRLQTNPLYYLAVPFFMGAQTIAIARLIRLFEPSIIHAHWWIPQALSALLARRLARKSIPVICTLHGADVFAFRGTLIRRLLSSILSRCAVVCPVSTAVRNYLPERIRESSKTTVAPMGVDMAETFQPIEGTQPQFNKFLYVGRLAAKKGVDWLLRSFARAVEEIPNLHLDIVGDGPMRSELERLASSLGILDRVSFLGARPHGELRRLYCGSSATIVPSVQARGGDQEGLGLTAVEALACGCPVIASDTPSLADIMQDGHNGIVVCQRDVGGLTRALLQLATDHQFQAGIRKVARPSVASYDWQSVASTYASVISGAIFHH